MSEMSSLPYSLSYTVLGYWNGKKNDEQHVRLNQTRSQRSEKMHVRL